MRRITDEELAALRRTPWVTTGTMARILRLPRKRVIRWCWDKQLRAGKVEGGNDWFISTADIPDGWVFPRQGPKLDTAALAQVRALAQRGGDRAAWAALEAALGWSYHKVHRWRKTFEKEARGE